MKIIPSNINKYIIIAPVSGSKNTNKEGIKVINIDISKNLNSLLIFPLGRDEAFLHKYSASVSFISSLGWKENIPRLNQALEPFMVLPKNRTSINNIILKMYKIKLYLNRSLGLMNFIIIKIISPSENQILCLKK